MVVERGKLWWASLPHPSGSQPGFWHPLLIVQSNEFSRSKINTVIAVAVTSNLRLAAAPGNMLLPAKITGLTKDSVANVSQVITVDKSFLTEKIGKLRPQRVESVGEGLRLSMVP